MDRMILSQQGEELSRKLTLFSVRLHQGGFHDAYRMAVQARDMILNILDYEIGSNKASSGRNLHD